MSSVNVVNSLLEIPRYARPFAGPAPVPADQQPKSGPAAEEPAHSAQARPAGPGDLFPEVQQVAAEHGLSIEWAQPVVNVPIPFFNTNTGGDYFTKGFVQDRENGYMLPAEWFFESPTNNVDRRLRAYEALQHGGDVARLLAPGEPAA